MRVELVAVGTLAVTFLMAVLIDRGAPNILDSIAFGIERTAKWTAGALRRSAAALRRRYRRLELEHEERVAGSSRFEQADREVSSRSSSAAA
jgi:hypothetical protein